MSHEWDDYHLTPRGWVCGSYKVDFNDKEKEVEPVDDRLLTRRYTERKADWRYKAEDYFQDTWIRDNSQAEIKNLLAQYPYPEGLAHYRVDRSLVE